MSTKITEQIRGLHCVPRPELKGRSEDISMQIEQLRHTGGINDDTAFQLLADLNNERSRLSLDQGSITNNGEPRDPKQALPIIDGPFKGMTFAHSANFFYLAQIQTPGIARLALMPDRSAGTARIRYCLSYQSDGRLVWSCAGE